MQEMPLSINVAMMPPRYPWLDQQCIPPSLSFLRRQEYMADMTMRPCIFWILTCAAMTVRIAMMPVRCCWLDQVWRNGVYVWHRINGGR